jgi:hypothetical protein
MVRVLINGVCKMEYELKLSNGKVVTWDGTDGLNACIRYADCFKDVTVIAWREVKTGVFPYNGNAIIE